MGRGGGGGGRGGGGGGGGGGCGYIAFKKATVITKADTCTAPQIMHESRRMVSF